jgi:cation diffusion facilitator family transporter
VSGGRDRVTSGVAAARRLALVGIGVNGALAAIHLAVGVDEGSRAVVATGVEFAGDVLASSVVFLGMVAAARPPDANHPYGHGRLETLAAFVVGLILAAGGVAICWNALQPVDVRPPPSLVAVAVLITAIAIRGVMSASKFRVGRRLGSASLVADAWNDAVDIVGAAAALVAVSLTRVDPNRFAAADHVGGFAVGIVVVLMAIRVVREASLDLMDTMPGEDLIRRVRATAEAVPGVVGVDKTFARKTGLQYHVDLHIEVDPAMTVAASHEVAGRVRSTVRSEVAQVADVLVHVEPADAGGAGVPTMNE